MMPFDAVVDTIDALSREDLERWVREELVRPVHLGSASGAPRWGFAEAECARVRLICTLYYELEIQADALELILSLIDQLHETRAGLQTLSRAVAMQEAGVRTAILNAVEQMQHRTSTDGD